MHNKFFFPMYNVQNGSFLKTKLYSAYVLKIYCCVTYSVALLLTFAFFIESDVNGSITTYGSMRFI